MMARIERLINQQGVAPENILGLTFTRNAAEEMRNRLQGVLGELAQRVTLSTMHGFCHYLLREEGRIFEIISGRDQIMLIRQVMKQLRIKDISVGLALSEISLAKNNLIDSSEFRAIHDNDKTMIRVGD